MLTSFRQNQEHQGPMTPYPSIALSFRAYIRVVDEGAGRLDLYIFGQEHFYRQLASQTINGAVLIASF